MVGSVNPVMLASYVALFGLWTLCQFVLVPLPVNLIGTSALIMYIGCHRSLRLRDKSSSEAMDSETLSKEDAMQFPLIGSAVLFSLYLMFKFFDKDLVNTLLAVYFAVAGAYAVGMTIDPILQQVMGTEQKRLGLKFNLPILGVIDLTLTGSELLGLVVGTVLSAVYFVTKHWSLNNIFGITFCVQAMERISLGSFKVGCILLVGLFLYDVFWVFGGPVMESVAKSVDGPIKLLFVIAWADSSADPPVAVKQSMLGLGDIVIPGLFCGLLLRFDAEMAKVDSSLAENGRFKKPYFHAALLAYMVGLGATVFVMTYFKAAQPALFYLVPACIGITLIVALFRKEMNKLLEYSEEEEVKKENNPAAEEPEGKVTVTTETTPASATAAANKKVD